MILLRARLGTETVLARTEPGAEEAVVVATESHHVHRDVLAECLASGTDPRLASGRRVRTTSLLPLSPVRHPAAIVGVGLNYRDHAREVGSTPGPRPLLFAKNRAALADPDAVVDLPSAEVDYEGELAVVIGREADRVSPGRALDHVLGYTVANDLTSRDVQREDTLWFRAKSFRGSCPLGPVVVTPEEIPDPQALTIITRVDGVAVQRGHTSDMVFGVAELVSFVSRSTPLVPGDVLLTGTPAGVGTARRPPLFLREGSEVTVRVEGVGELRTLFRAPGEGPGGR